MKKEISAGVIVYYDEVHDGFTQRLYLTLNYRKGYWDLPKGKLEGDETNLDAAIRELQEETGLTAQIHPGFEQSLSYIFKNFQGQLIDKSVTFFVGKVDTQQVILSAEHLSYQWAPYKAMLKLLTYANAQHVLTMADHFIDNLNSHHVQPKDHKDN